MGLDGRLIFKGYANSIEISPGFEPGYMVLQTTD